MGQGWTAHVHQCRQVDDAFFHMTQKPEQFDPIGIRQAAEQPGHRRKVGVFRQIFQDIIDIFSMIVGQLILSHDNPSNSRCCFYYTTKGDAAYAASPL